MTSNTAYSNNDCPHKLPCGLCRLTMMNCPKGWWTYSTTCTTANTANTTTAGTSQGGVVDCGWK